MSELKGSQTHQNLNAAFAFEAGANRRYLYFARLAEIEGHPDIGMLFREAAEADTGHAFGHLDFLKSCGDPATQAPIGKTESNLASAADSQAHAADDFYPELARVAREEGFPEIAEWFETLARADAAHESRFRKALEKLEG